MTDPLTAEKKREAILQRLESDPHAPRYHFSAPEGNAMPFDPNGAIFWQGRYHLFYIFQDPKLPHGGHCWGHASSRDLLHWDFLPTALAPRPGDPDKGIFSGNAFVSKEGVPTIAYYGIGTGICLAQSTDDDLTTWTKRPENPVIPEPGEGDPGWGVYNVFDPHIWLENGTYYAILGGRVKPHDIRDTAYLFESQDLVSWRYLRPFYHPHPDWTDRLEDCACPDFFPLGERHALVCISHSHGARYYLGRWKDGTFVPEEHQRMNWPGGSCFAPETLLDDQGRRILWTWVLDQRKGEGRFKNELGVMSLPRALSLDAAGRLNIHPVAELEKLRRHPWYIENLAVDPGQEQTVTDVRGDCLELTLEAAVPEGAAFGVKVRVSPGGEEQTAIRVDRASGTLSIDTSQSSLRPDLFQPFPMMGGETCEDVRIQTAPFTLDPGERLQLRLFLDRSILEVFANDRQCLTQRIYPTRDDSLGVALFSQGSRVEVARLAAWELVGTNGKTQ